MPNRTLPLDDDGMYHLCNRAVGNETLFRTSEEYLKFLNNINKYLLPQVSLWSYCLLPNHFHLLFRIKDESTGEIVSKAISDCCNSYAKWMNIISKRKGNLFMRPFKRNKIKNDNHLAWTIWYIHRNPMHHHVTDCFEHWKYSSYKTLSSQNDTKVARTEVLDFFGNRERFIGFHQEQQRGYFDGLEDE